MTPQQCKSWLTTNFPSNSPAQKVLKLVEGFEDASNLLGEIMRDEVNHQDEAEKWLREFAPDQLFLDNV